jgi:cysteine desulfurase
MDIPDPKYFDYAASVPPLKEAVDSFVESSNTYFANPSSIHFQGRKAKKNLLQLKKKYCELLKFYDGRLMICSSATEANNTVIEGFIKRFPGKRILIAEDAHDSIWYATEKYPGRTSVLKIEPDGKINEEKLLSSISGDIALICLNHICSETGIIHNVNRLAQICQSHGLKVMIDGTQAIGHIPVNLNDTLFDYYSFSGHKFGAVKSIGGLLMRDKDFDPLLSGGKQEWEIRGGTENVSGLASAVAALNWNLQNQSVEMQRLNSLYHTLSREFQKSIPGVLINSSPDGLPGLLSVSFPGMKGNELVAAASLSGYSISTGSACHANQVEPSRIILAMDRNEHEATGTVRISMGYGTTNESVEGLLKAIKEYIGA